MITIPTFALSSKVKIALGAGDHGVVRIDGDRRHASIYLVQDGVTTHLHRLPQWLAREVLDEALRVLPHEGEA